MVPQKWKIQEHSDSEDHCGGADHIVKFWVKLRIKTPPCFLGGDRSWGIRVEQPI